MTTELYDKITRGYYGRIAHFAQRQLMEREKYCGYVDGKRYDVPVKTFVEKQGF
jgi:hypothetical protein